MALFTLGLAHRANVFERLGDLIVELYSVGDDHKGPVAGQLAQDLLRKEHHREALAAPLCLPEYTTATVAEIAGLEHRSNGVVDAEELVVLTKDLYKPSFVFREQSEILD